MNNMITDLGTNIDVEPFQKYIDISQSLPHVEKIYGAPYNVPEYPCWMDYGSPEKGSISFTRNTYLHSALYEMCKTVADIIQQFFPKLVIIPERVHIIKTVKGVPIHRDEGGRLSCINSTTAVTKFGIDDRLDTFESNHADFVLQDGHIYLVNVSIFHSVRGTTDERYLITYGFGETYEELLGQILTKDSCIK
jgi:hypothetical protein